MTGFPYVLILGLGLTRTRRLLNFLSNSKISFIALEQNTKIFYKLQMGQK